MTQRTVRAIICLVISLFTLAAHSANQQVDPKSLLATGNDAFHRGDYDAAIDSYKMARSKGFENALLSFNMGVAYYKLGDYEKAHDAFVLAARDSEFSTLSYLNLGLNERKRGNLDKASAWFEQARKHAENEAVRRHVTRVLSLVGDEQLNNNKKRSIRTAAASREPEFAWFLSTMMAFDSNAYRAPSSPYNDLSQAGSPLVNPQTQSGFYVPVLLRAEYAYPVGKTSNLGGTYQYRGDHYLESKLNNAEESAHRFAVGYEKLLGERLSTRRRIAAAVVYEIHEETDFDRDDGAERVANGENVSDRFDYNSAGFEAALRDRKGRFGYGADARFEQRDYKGFLNIFSYDHDFLMLGGYVNYRNTPRSRTELEYRYYLRDYDERLARDRLGNVSIANEALKYTYHQLRISHRQRFTDALLAEFSYAYMIRDDDFVGYNDYDQHQIRVTGSYRFSPKFRSVIRLSWRDLNYPHAFAFNDPAGGQQTYEELQFHLITEYSLTERWSAWIRIHFEDIDSADPRGAYDRTRASIGVSWKSL